MSKFLVFDKIINVSLCWLFNKIIVSVLPMFNKVIFFLIFQFLILLRNWKTFCKMLAFYLIWIMLHNHKCFTAFCLFQEIWWISFFSSFLKRRRIKIMWLIRSSWYRCNSFLDNWLNLLIRILFRRIHHVRNSLRVISLLIAPCIFNSNVNWIWGLK